MEMKLGRPAGIVTFNDDLTQAELEAIYTDNPQHGIRLATRDEMMRWVARNPEAWRRALRSSRSMRAPREVSTP
jgi:hypothetical protein